MRKTLKNIKFSDGKYKYKVVATYDNIEKLMGGLSYTTKIYRFHFFILFLIVEKNYRYEMDLEKELDKILKSSEIKQL